MCALVSASNLSAGFNRHVVLKDVNFEVEAGDFICVVGANGSGKSTLVKTILGLIKPFAGSVEFGDGLTKTAIGYLPQESKIDQNFPATVQEIVMSGNLGRMRFKPFYGASERAAATKSLQLLGIEKLKNVSFADLSGGQKQKVLLARSLTATTKLLILDEPSNNLDFASRQDFYQTLLKLNRAGLTIIMITHDLDVDDLIGNRVFAIKDATLTTFTTKKYLRSFR